MKQFITACLLILSSACTTTVKTTTVDGDLVKKVYYTRELKRYERNTAAGIPDSVACKKIIRVLNPERYHKPIKKPLP